MTKENTQANDQLHATAEIVSSYLLNHKVEMKELESVIERVFTTVSRLSPNTATNAQASNQIVSVEDSITPEFIICLEDGKPLKMLKRYLRNNYNMSPEEYRKRWNLPASYPMVAPNYAKKRSQLAKDIGLGKQKAEHRRKSLKYTKPATKNDALPGGSLHIVSASEMAVSPAV